jgi:hypothetical protein
MARRKIEILKLIAPLFLSLLLVLGAGLAVQVQAATVIFDYEHGTLNEDAGEFTFDVLVGDISDMPNFGGWQLTLGITRQGEDLPFSFHFDPDIVKDPDYVLHGNSDQYIAYITPPQPPSASAYQFLGGDIHDEQNGSIPIADAEGKILARLTLDEVEYCDWFVIEILDSGQSVFMDSELNMYPIEVGTKLVHVVPIPPALILLGSGLIGLIGLRRRFIR